MELTDVTVEYHRNGVCGTGFYAVLFTACVENARKPQRFLATVFPENGSVAVLDLDKLATVGIKFGYNSWRGDHFESALRAEIQKANDALEARFKAEFAAKGR